MGHDDPAGPRGAHLDVGGREGRPDRHAQVEVLGARRRPGPGEAEAAVGLEPVVALVHLREPDVEDQPPQDAYEHGEDLAAVQGQVEAADVVGQGCAGDGVAGVAEVADGRDEAGGGGQEWGEVGQAAEPGVATRRPGAGALRRRPAAPIRPLAGVVAPGHPQGADDVDQGQHHPGQGPHGGDNQLGEEHLGEARGEEDHLDDGQGARAVHERHPLRSLRAAVGPSRPRPAT